MSHRQIYLSTWSIFAMLCGLCISIALLAYVNLSESIGSMEVKKLPLPRDKQKANCSHSILRSFYKINHSFPESGVWLRDPKKKNEMFVPSMCELRNCDIFNMFRKKGIKNVLFLGDSQGRYSFFALRKYITSSSDWSCTTIHLVNRGDFFALEGAELLNADDKSGVFDRQAIVSTILCTQIQYNFTVKIQFILIRFWDESVIVSGYHDIPKFQCSFVEFIFKYYLLNNYPELVVIFSQFNHIKQRINITKSEFFDHFIPLRNLVKSVMPRTTWVQWLTNPMEFERARKKSSLKYKGILYNGYLAGEVMFIFSQWLYEALADILVSPNTNHLGFFNVANMTASMVKRSFDGIHFDTLWYGKWMEYMLLTMCHSQ